MNDKIHLETVRWTMNYLIKKMIQAGGAESLMALQKSYESGAEQDFYMDAFFRELRSIANPQRKRMMRKDDGGELSMFDDLVNGTWSQDELKELLSEFDEDEGHGNE